MKVLIDGYFLNKPRGMGRYLQELLYALGRYADSDFEFLIALPSVSVPPTLASFSNLHYLALRSAPFPIWEQVLLPRLISRLKPDAVHFPYNTSPLVSSAAAARIVTVHDLMFITNRSIVSGNIYQRLGNTYRSLIVNAYRWQKKRIITDSSNSAALISTVLGKDSEVVYIPTEFWGASDSKPFSAKTADKFLLHVGGLSPHKNTRRTIAAFLAADLEATNLVVLGVPKDNPFLEMCSADNRVIFPGWVSDEQIKAFYSQALGVIFPSLAEGYGLPIVEALSFGIPLITSNLEPMREIAGGGAILVDPYSQQELCAAIKRIGQDSDFRTELCFNAKVAVERMSSERMADQMCGIYRSAINKC